jgi:carbamoyl-phosphate synthase large subunit
MPKRTSILIIGAGPIVIGQACEFDYSGAQACKALREEGFRVILVNSNPATIMTDPEMADATYIEPITWQVVEKIIARRSARRDAADHGRPDRAELRARSGRHGVLEKYGVETDRRQREAIDKAEDREKFKDAMTKIGLESRPDHRAQLEEALGAAHPGRDRRHRLSDHHPPQSSRWAAPAAASPTTAKSSRDLQARPGSCRRPTNC